MQWKESGIDITVNDDGRFVAEVQDVKISETTLLVCRDSVVKALSAIAKGNKLNLPIVGIFSPKPKYGEQKVLEVRRAVLTGVNRTTRNFMLSTGDELTRIMPDTPKNMALLEKWLAIQVQYQDLSVRTMGIGSLGYGRIDAGEYDSVLAKVRAQYDKLKGGN